VGKNIRLDFCYSVLAAMGRAKKKIKVEEEEGKIYEVGEH